MAISGNSEQSYNTHLLHQLASIAKWHQLEDPEKKKAIWKFMYAIGNLYMDYFNFSLAEAQTCISIYHDHLKKEIHQIIKPLSPSINVQT